jgi:hypothetical protein
MGEDSAAVAAPGAATATSAPGAVRAASEGTRGRVPDFFIVGHEKCGTTALYLILSRHPRIFMPKMKEPRFFTPELRSRFKRLGPGTLPETLEQYTSLFAGAEPAQIAGEASPSYLKSPYAASRIAEVQPAARIIAILREPASFLRSFHLQAVHNHVETERDFAKALALEEARRAGKRVPRFSQLPEALLYTEHVRYVEQLRRFHAVFPPEQVLVLIYDDFRADNEATARRVMRFLQVDDAVPIETTETIRLQGVRSVVLLRLGLAVSIARRKTRAGGPALKALGRLLPNLARGTRLGAAWHRTIYDEPPPPDEALMLELRRRFKPEVVALSEYLGRDLVSLWGYENVD